MRVYLAGGLRSGWQDTCLAIPDVEWFDPRQLSGNLDDIACEERERIRHSDVVLAYNEASNPRPFGMFAEVGYACACGIDVIYVNERDESSSRWLSSFCVLTTDTLSEAIEAVVSR